MPRRFDSDYYAMQRKSEVLNAPRVQHRHPDLCEGCKNMPDRCECVNEKRGAQNANLQPIVNQMLGLQGQMQQLGNNQDPDVNNAVELFNQALDSLQSALAKPGL